MGDHVDHRGRRIIYFGHPLPSITYQIHTYPDPLPQTQLSPITNIGFWLTAQNLIIKYSLEKILKGKKRKNVVKYRLSLF